MEIKELHQGLKLSFIEFNLKNKPSFQLGDASQRQGNTIIDEIFPIEYDGKSYGQIRIIKDIWTLKRSNNISIVWLFLILFLQFVVFIIVKRFINSQILKPISQLIGQARKQETLDLKSNHLKLQTNAKEIDDLKEALENLLKENNDYQVKLIQSERQSALAQLATQVAHDVRSPLAALDLLLKEMNALPEEMRVIGRSAVTRIRDICNNLLTKNKSADQAPSSDIEVLLLSSLLDGLISEKRLQFRSKMGVKIEFDLNENVYGLFAKINATEFKRMVSNLINNAVESFKNDGKVEILLYSEAENIVLKIKDNGAGIPKDILVKLGVRGETHGKAGGSGLGLFHAKNTVKIWGGDLRLESEVGVGTTATITLPKIPAPAWFVPLLTIKNSQNIVILDDDTSIHQIWDGRFAELNVSLHHHSTPETFSNWVHENDKNSSALYLCDYELLGHNESGLDLIEKLGIGNQSILVTSRFEEKSIRERCERLKVRLIPKGMAGFVPIVFAEIVKQELFDAVLIDDDSLVHWTWDSAAKLKNKKLKLFSHPKDFFPFASTLNKATPIYVDANLGNGIHGEEVAKQISDMGFASVYLATGYEPDNYQHLTFLKGVCGKDPPWIPPME